MAVDTNKITALVDEMGLPEANKTYLIQTLTDPANEAAAQRFISQRVRHDDYTRRTQELATERQTLEQRLTSESQRYASELQQADEKIRRIMDDLSTERISRATADARLQRVKEVYNLSDDDIPKVDPQQPPAGQNQDPANQGLTEERFNSLLTDFRKNLLKELGGEMSSFPKVAAVLDEISDQHLQLTGKRLTIKEKNDLMTEAAKDGSGGLMNVWRNQYGIADIEKKNERDEWTRAERQKWDDEQKARNSEAALSGVRRFANDQQTTVSPVLGRKYTEHTDPADTHVDQPPARTVNTPPAPSGPKPSGAERAAAKFLERRAAGIPMGERAPARSA